MENSYRFFANKACAYFPCHKVSNEDDFNCLFCYCPLYFLEECGGNHKQSNGVKDCSDCMIPHGPRGYDHIVNKIVEVNAEKIIEGYKKNNK